MEVRPGSIRGFILDGKSYRQDNSTAQTLLSVFRCEYCNYRLGTVAVVLCLNTNNRLDRILYYGLALTFTGTHIFVAKFGRQSFWVFGANSIP